MPLGIQACHFSELAVEIAAGTRLVFYSDGITEAMDPSSELYGEKRLREHVARPSATVQSLLEDVRSFSSGQPASDDITVVMIRARERAEEAAMVS